MSGVISKVTNTVTGRKELPKYSQAGATEAQKKAAELQSKYGVYDVDSSLGGISTVQQDDGTFKRVYTDSAADEQRNALIGQGLSGISLNPTAAQDAYYNQATRRLLPEFEQQQERLDTNLINRGIGIGTEQYNDQMANLQDTQQGTLSDIGSQAVFQGQNLLSNQISNIGALTGQRDIGGLAGLGTSTGTSFQETYSPFVAQNNLRRKDQNQANEQFMSQLASFGASGGLGTGAQGFLNPTASDIRLKENLQEIGVLDNGLSIYIGNYNDKAIELDGTLDKKPQLFLIAQEVQDIKPSAVIKMDNGYYAVDYTEAVK